MAGQNKVFRPRRSEVLWAKAIKSQMSQGIKPAKHSIANCPLLF
jgi:hypothetical protein